MAELTCSPRIADLLLDQAAILEALRALYFPIYHSTQGTVLDNYSIQWDCGLVAIMLWPIINILIIYEVFC